ncbi:MAG TPA: hypothetical protein VG077_16650 [Verrucomicrobiae bacterium]|nr:hypothetical protein [Verrucomicrobiae bacterium]
MLQIFLFPFFCQRQFLHTCLLLLFDESKNATLAIVRLWVSVFIKTRCQIGSVMVSWLLWHTVPRA